MPLKSLLSTILLILALGTFTTQAQEFEISGILQDSLTKKPLEASTVFLETIKDSTLVGYTISDDEGKFHIEGDVNVEALYLYVSFIGYKPVRKRIDLSKLRLQDLKTLYLRENTENLSEVVVMGKTPPIRFKKDTVEFNTAAFKTKQDANIEDLLKVMPGFEVDENGAVTYNGKPVNKILVNGKPFFGSDPTIATQNITKEMVKKIQVVDSRSKTQAFTGEKSDGENKTINIRIDKDKNKGSFGRAAVAGGTDDRYEYAGLGNYFDNDLQLSVITGGNNVNKSGFDYGEIQRTFGQNAINNIPNMFQGNYGGITDSKINGINYADNYGKNTEATVSYFHNFSSTINESRNSSKNILPDRVYFSEGNYTSKNTNFSHKINPEFETVLDSVLFLEYRPNFTYTESDNSSSNTGSTFDENRSLVNSSSGTNQSYGYDKTLNNKLSLTRRYGVDGGFLRIDLDGGYSDNTSNGLNKSESLIYEEGSDGEILKDQIIRDQRTENKNTSNNYGSELQWNIPLIAQKLFVSAKSRYTTNTRNESNLYFDRVGSGTNFVFNPSQSTDYTNKNKELRPQGGISFRGEKLNMEANLAYSMLELESMERINDIQFTNTFDAVEADANLRYQISRTKNISIRYNLDNRAPDIRQLSPFIDNRNPLYTNQGNPFLRSTKNHNVSVNYSFYNTEKRSNMYVYSSINWSYDDVTVRTLIDPEDLSRSTTYINVSGNWRAYGGANYNGSKELDSTSTLSYRGSLSGNFSKQANFINGEEYNSRNYLITPSLALTYSRRDLGRIELSYRPSFGSTIFDVEDLENTNFNRHTVSLNAGFELKKFEWNNVLNYSYNSNIADGYRKGTVFWNSGITYSIMKNDGLISLRAYDLLNQNNNAQRYASGQYITDVESNVLQRYILLGFSYKFNTLGSKGQLSNKRAEVRYY